MIKTEKFNLIGAIISTITWSDARSLTRWLLCCIWQL